MPSFNIIGLLVLEKKIFKGFLPYIGIGGHLGHVTWTIYRNVCFTFPRKLYIKFSFGWPRDLGGDVLKIVDRRTDRRTQWQGYTISSHCAPNGSGELIKGGMETSKLIERTK